MALPDTFMMSGIPFGGMGGGAQFGGAQYASAQYASAQYASAQHASAQPRSTPWPAAPSTPFQTHAESVRLWSAHTAASLTWLRAHDMGVRMLPSLERPDLLTGVGVLVEPRDHADTEFVLRNWAHFTSSQGWGLIIVHGSKNEAFMRGLTAGWPNVGFVNCGVDDLPLPQYQRVLTDPTFWERFIAYPRVMIFQTDTAQLCGDTLGPRSAFLEYDYVGAPWANACFVCGAALVPSTRVCGHLIDNKALLTLAPHLVGNGGLSLRNPRAMLEVCTRFRLPTDTDDKREPIADVTNEDTFTCVALHKLGKRIAPRAVAATFAMEQVAPQMLDPDVPPCTGIHKPWAYQRPDVMRCVLASVQYTDKTSGSTFRPSPLSSTA